MLKLELDSQEPKFMKRVINTFKENNVTSTLVENSYGHVIKIDLIDETFNRTLITKTFIDDETTVIRHFDENGVQTAYERITEPLN